MFRNTPSPIDVMETATPRQPSIGLSEFSGGSRQSAVDSTLDERINNTLVSARSGDRSSATTRLLVVADHVDATQEISFLKPLREVASGISVDVISGAHLDLMAEMSMQAFGVLVAKLCPTHMFFSRYTGQHLPNLQRLARSHSIPTICFLDDDLLNVPRELGEHIHALFSGGVPRKSLTDGIRKSDLMLCSTPQLLKSLSALRTSEQMTRCCEIYRSVSDCELDRIPAVRSNGPFTIGYMASSSHIADFRAWLPDITRFLANHPESRMEFFGTIAPPSELESFGERISRQTKASSYTDFMEKLRSMDWHIGLAPLLDTPFNSNKAPTKWVEYTLAGIPTLASPVIPYESAISASACHPATEDDLYKTLVHMAQNPNMRSEILANAKEELKTHYHVEKHVEALKTQLQDVSRSVSA